MSFFNKASLLTIPTAYKQGKLYSVKPTDGSGDFTFLRLTTGTRINESGLIESVGVDVPRIDYSSGSPALLLEPQRTNFLPYSEDISTYSKVIFGTGVNPTVTLNYGISPEGLNNAVRIQFDAGTNGLSSIRQFVNTGSNPHTATKSVYIKSLNGNVSLNLGDGLTGSKKRDVTTEWQRFQVTDTISSTTHGFHLMTNTAAGNPITSQVADVLVYGAQIEVGAYATSYIPTSGTSVTRVADEIRLLQLSSYFPNPSKGTIFFEFEDKGHRGTGSSARFIFRNSASADQLAFITRPDGFLFYDYNSQSGIDYLISSGTQVGQTYKFAITFNGKIAVGFANGLKESTQTSVNDFEINEWIFTSFIHSSLSFKNIMFFPTALSDAECITLTTI